MNLNPDVSRSNANTVQTQIPDTGSGAGSGQAPVANTADAYEVAQSNQGVIFGEAQGGASAQDIQAMFAEKFGQLASDPEAFHALMKQVFGEGYDRAAAEGIRQQTLAGDTSWMPEIEFVSAETLQGGYGAYDSANNKIYLNESLQNQPALAAQVYAEEVGHFLDTQLRTTDSAGDEGELFRRLLSGESLSGSQVAEIRAENDHGVIEVNGKKVSVEFWGFGDIGDSISSGWDSFTDSVSSGWDSVTSSVSDGWDSFSSSVSDGWNSVTSTVSDGWNSVTSTVSDGWNAVTDWAGDTWDSVTETASSAWDNVSSWASDAWDTTTSAVRTAGDWLVNGPVGTAVSSFGTGMWNTATTLGSTVWDAAVDFGTAAWDGITETVDHLSRGEIADAGRAALRGFDRAVLQTPARLFNGAVDAGFEFVDGVSHLMGPLGGPFREGAGRVLDGARAIGNFGIGTVRDVVRTPVEMAIDLGEGLWDTGEHLVNGRWGDAASTFGSTLGGVALRPLGTGVDIVVRGAAALANAGGTLVGVGSIDRPVSELLTPDQLADLEATYDGSLDLDHVYVDQGGLVAFGGIAKVVGNTVYLPDGYFDSSGALTSNGFDVLQHELGHVWQNQNGGGDYLHNALFSQFTGWVSGGSRSGAYDWRPAVASGTDFGDLNPEQQAEVIATLSHLTENGGVPDTGDSVWDLGSSSMQNLTQAEVDFLNESLDDLRAGRTD